MAVVDLSSYKVANDEILDPNKFNNALDAIQASVNDIVDAQVDASAGIAVSKLSGPYSVYVPTWTASGSGPSIGNSAVTARYIEIGKLVHAYGRIQFGSSGVNFGTGTYAFALPVTAAAGFSILQVAGAGFLSQGANEVAATAYMASASTLAFQYGATYLGAGTVVGQLAPYTWASTGVISWNITYEAA